MRLLPALALLAALAASGPTLAQSPGKPLARDAVTSLLKGNDAWCAAWRQSDRSCEEVIFLQSAKDSVTQTRRYRMSDRGGVEMVVRQSGKLEDQGLCWTFRFVDLDIAFLNEGVRAPAEQSAALILLMRESMSELEGKKVCERFSRDGATGEVLSTTTIDGEVAPEFESRFRLLAPDERVKLRPLFELDDEPTST